MSSFEQFAQAVSGRVPTRTELYEVDLGLTPLYDTYLAAFATDSDPIFRERTSHNCNACKNFINNLGSVVWIEGGKVQTVWDVKGVGDIYGPVAAALHERLITSPIVSVYRTDMGQYGSQPNFDNHDPNIKWVHFFAKVPAQCVSPAPGAAKNTPNSAFTVLKGGLSIITMESLDIVLDLIQTRQLYKGDEFKAAVEGFRALKAKSDGSDIYCWTHCGNKYAGFKNTAIGTLLVDLSEGMELDAAVRAYGKKVDPINYKHTITPISQPQVNAAVKKLEELGMEDSIHRRFAVYGDLSLTDVQWVNGAVKGQMKGGMADLLKSAVKPNLPNSAHATPITIQEFMRLGKSDIEMVLDNSHLNNLMALTAPVHPDSPSLFSWDNSFGWSYVGDVTDSIKERVGKAGGKIKNVALRCSLAWFNRDDLDLHCYAPNSNHIYYARKQNVLDVDMNAGSVIVTDAVENLSWANSPTPGTYRIAVNQFRNRCGNNDVGFDLELEFNGQLHNYKYDRRVDGEVEVLSFEVGKAGQVTNIQALNGLVDKVGTKVEKWGISTLTPTTVTTILKSPNHWENSSKNGALHWLFVLEDCASTEPLRGIYSEFLRPDLIPHRKVWEVLGSRTKCEVGPMLAGVGFSSTRDNTVLLYADKKPYKVSFNHG